MGVNNIEIAICDLRFAIHQCVLGRNRTATYMWMYAFINPYNTNVYKYFNIF